MAPFPEQCYVSEQKLEWEINSQFSVGFIFRRVPIYLLEVECVYLHGKFMCLQGPALKKEQMELTFGYCGFSMFNFVLVHFCKFS